MEKMHTMKQALDEILDLDLLNKYIEQMYELIHIPITILDDKGEIILASKWTDLCENYMRTDGITNQKCVNVCSRIGDFGEGIFQCPNGLCMYSVPIKYKETTIAYLVISQFLMVEPNIEMFSRFAYREGIDQNIFLKALKEIPVVPEDTIQKITNLFKTFVMLLRDMIERKLKAKELEEEIMQSYEELEASYQDISLLNDQLNILNLELSNKNDVISSKEQRYRVLVHKMKQGTLILKRNEDPTIINYHYTVDEMNAVMSDLPGRQELIDYILLNIKVCIKEKKSIFYNFGHQYYEIEGAELENNELMVCVTDITAVREKLNYRREQNWHLVVAMGKLVEKRDLYTADHQKKVAVLAVRMAIELGLSEDKIESVFVASLLHDIGKISIPSEILTKPDKLSTIEFELMKTHVNNAQDILKMVRFNLPIVEIVMQHHERLNGTGYPEQLTGDQICLEAKVIAVADVYEAITTHRPYRPALGHDFAKDHLEEEIGKLYDEQVVKACVKISQLEPWDMEDLYRYIRNINEERLRNS